MFQEVMEVGGPIIIYGIKNTLIYPHNEAQSYALQYVYMRYRGKGCSMIVNGAANVDL